MANSTLEIKEKPRLGCAVTVKIDFLVIINTTSACPRPLPVRVPSTSEGSSIGAALLAYKALGVFDSFDDATDLVSIIKTVDPQSGNTLRYQACYDQFQALYRHLKPLFQKLRGQKET
jgi:glycerol kinase